MQQLDGVFLASVEKSNHLDVDQGYSLQVQRNGRRLATYLRSQCIDMFRL